MVSHARAHVDASEEGEIRRELAACYRLAAKFGWDDTIATHMSARLPGDDGFLLNPFGLLFEEISASGLVKVDYDGRVIDGSGASVNRAGFVIHSAVHEARPDAACVIHLHTLEGVAVSVLEEGLLPLHQSAMLIYDDIAYHEFEGVATRADERVRLAQDLGDKNLMILRNHGLLALGPTIGDAFCNMYKLQWSCAVQVRALAMGRTIHAASDEAMEAVKSFRHQAGRNIARELIWPALLRKAERECKGFDD